MHKFTITKEIDAPVDEVWALLDKFSDTYVYHPAVEHSKSVNGKATGLGAQRQCDMYNGVSVQERITDYQPDQRNYQITMVDFGSFPLKQMIVRMGAKPSGQNKTVLTYDGGFQTKYGPMGWMMAKMMMLPMFKKMTRKIIDGIEAHIITGKIVGKNGKLTAESLLPA